MRMTKTASLLVVAALLAGCGQSRDADGKTSYNAFKEASHPFSIGNVTDNEMGAAPPGEMSLPKGYDPYAGMKDRNDPSEAISPKAVH